MNDHLSSQTPSRRNFLKTSAAVAGTAVASGLVALQIYAAGSDVLRIGLVGCGSRGSGAVRQALNADENVKLVAMGDAFLDRMQQCLNGLKDNPELAPKISVTPETMFTGFEAYKQVIAHVDVVLLATPPHFRPLHLRAAIDANKHVFTEKPMAVDAPGVRRVLAACEEAKKKNLSVVSGFCWRYHPTMRETMRRIHGGALGTIQALQCTYNTGGLWVNKRKPGMADMEYQMRNWYYFTWLSGDHNVEQHIHSLDKMAWAMQNEYPIKAVGLGGRQSRTGPEFGQIFDHHAVVYEFESGARLYSFCRQQNGCSGDVSDRIMGTKGVCSIIASFPPRVKITGEHPWATSRNEKDDDMYQVEHNELFASIRNQKPINNGDWMARSTLMAIMGRMATYTGQDITWDMAMNSKEDLTPPQYDMSASVPTPPVARPGITKFM